MCLRYDITDKTFKKKKKKKKNFVKILKVVNLQRNIKIKKKKLRDLMNMRLIMLY